jgi:hypothetical protein
VQGGLTATQLVALPIRLNGIQLGRPVEIAVDVERMRAVGLEVLCGDGATRFLPFAATLVRSDEISIASALVLLDESQVDFYRERARTARSLIGVPLRLGARRLGEVSDLVIAADGSIVALDLDGPEGSTRLEVDATVALELLRGGRAAA